MKVPSSSVDLSWVCSVFAESPELRSSGVKNWEKAIAKARRLPITMLGVCNLFFLISASEGDKSIEIKDNYK